MLIAWHNFSPLGGNFSMFCVSLKLGFLIFAFHFNFKPSDSVVHYFFDQKSPSFQQRLGIVSGMCGDIFCWPLQNLLKFGQIINIWKIHSANFLHIKKLNSSSTSMCLLLIEPYVVSFTAGKGVSWILSLVRDFHLLAALCSAKGRQGPMSEWRSSCPVCFVLHVASSYHSRNLEKGGVQKADLEKDKEQN